MQKKQSLKGQVLLYSLKPIFLSVLASLFFSLVIRGFVMTEKWYDHTSNTGDENPILLP